VKNCSKRVLEENTSDLAGEAPDWIAFCLRRLYADRKHTISQEVVYGLVFEELIGALQAAREYIRAGQKMETMLEKNREKIHGRIERALGTSGEAS